MNDRDKTFLTGFLIVTILAAITIPMIIMVENQEEEKPDYSHLMPERPEVADEDNAYTYFLKAEGLAILSNGFSEVMQDFKKGKSFETNKIEQILADNAEMFAAVKDGLKCDLCVAPKHVLNDSSSFPNISEQIRVINLLACRVRYQRLTGDYSNAVESCIISMEYASLRYRYPNSFVSYLVNCGTLGIIMHQTSALIHDESIDDEGLIQLLDVLKRTVEIRDSLAFAAKSEFESSMVFLPELKKTKLKDLGLLFDFDVPSFVAEMRAPGYLFDSRKAKELLFENCMVMVSNSPLPFASMTLFEEKEMEMKTLDAFNPDALNDLLFNSCASVNNSCLKQACRYEFRLKANQLLAALILFERQRGILPGKLQQLVPEYIDAVPLDPYDGNQVRYDPHRVINFECAVNRSQLSVCMTGIVYSVDEDLIDQGRSTNIKVGSDRPRAFGEQKARTLSLELMRRLRQSG